MKRKLSTKFYQFGNNPIEDKTETLSLGGYPNKITFVVTGSSIAGLNKFVIVNKLFQLQPYTDTVTGTAQAPYKLELIGHENDVIINQFTLEIPKTVIVQVFCEFFA